MKQLVEQQWLLCVIQFNNMNSRLNVWIILLILCFLALGYVSFKEYKTQNELKINQEKLSQLESSYSIAYLKFTSVLPNEIEEYVKKNDSVIVYLEDPIA